MNAVIRPLWFRVRGAAVRTIGYDRIVRMFMNPARLAGEPQCLVDFVFGDRHVALAPCRIRRLPPFLCGERASRGGSTAPQHGLALRSLLPR